MRTVEATMPEAREGAARRETEVDTLVRVHAVARVTLAFVLLWHGLVPKLLFRHPDEYRLLADGGVPRGWMDAVTTAHGVGEVALGLAFLVLWRARWLFPLVLAFMAASLAAVAAASPRFLTAAFNPVTLNACVAALAAVGWSASRALPSARRRVRRGLEIQR